MRWSSYDSTAFLGSGPVAFRPYVTVGLAFCWQVSILLFRNCCNEGVNIEMWRAHEWVNRFTGIRRFRLRGKWHSDRASRFHKPPYDPGRSAFTSPVLTLSSPPTAFRDPVKLKC